MNIMAKILPKLNKLIDSWCERRCLKPLCYILRDYLIYTELTEGSGGILESLQEIKGLCCHELAVEERRLLSELIRMMQNKRGQEEVDGDE